MTSSITPQTVGARCPFSTVSRQARTLTKSINTQLSTAPTWVDDILPMIQAPYWLPEGSRAATGAGWIKAMKYWGPLSLDNYTDVKSQCVTIYDHLRSKSMPVTEDPTEYWPEDALEKLRSWANAGFPETKSDTPTPQTIIPTPIQPVPTYRVRRDIMSLSTEELAVYQAKLDDVLGVGQLGSKWQELGLLHAEWCLHYQEATFLWHRAYLKYIEELIDYPIPYWNGFAKDSGDPESLYAGVPRVFFDETYIHPIDGTTRPNPLKYALALDGKSKVPPSPYVTRDPTLVQGKTSPGWSAKVALFTLYHQQIGHALSQTSYTSAGDVEGYGHPWQNIPNFGDDNPDSWYPHRFDFDGLFEQVHDNFHGWVGGDMADNSYTAFDPIFLAYHCNMDRLSAIFIESHPEMQFTSAFPLQPFTDGGKTLSYDEPRRWAFTTIGDMAKPTKALGYMFALPADADVAVQSATLGRPAVRVKASGGRAVTLAPRIVRATSTTTTTTTTTITITSKTNGAGPAEAGTASTAKTPFIVFDDVGCTDKSYTIDVFVKNPKSLSPNPVENPDYIGRITRLGMGPGRADGGLRNARRCREPSASRVLSAAKVGDRLTQDSTGDEALHMVVMELATGEIVGSDVYGKLSGFGPQIAWLRV